MTDFLISVIVPVYNVEKYIERCVNSLVNQTYKNIEIILVDDGSKDSSGQLCDQLSEKYSIIKVVHKKNGGLSSARNAGILRATGDFITFLDSDDWLELDTYQYCLDLMEKYKSDCIEFDTIMVKNEDPISQREEMIRCYDGKEILQYYLLSSTKTGSYSVCRCLFPKLAIENLSFREGKINEDIDFKYKALSKCSRLVVSNLYKYHYYQSGNSLSIGGLKKRDFDLYEASDALVELTNNEKYGKIAYLGNVKKARTAFSLLSKIAYCGFSDSSLDRKKVIKKLTKENRHNIWILLNAPIPFSRKILALLFAANYGIASICVKIGKKLVDLK